MPRRLGSCGRPEWRTARVLSAAARRARELRGRIRHQLRGPGVARPIGPSLGPRQPSAEHGAAARGCAPRCGEVRMPRGEPYRRRRVGLRRRRRGDAGNHWSRGNGQRRRCFGIRLAWSPCAVWVGCAAAWAVVRCPVGWPCCGLARAVASDVGWPDDDGTEEEAGAVGLWPAGEAAGTAGAGDEGGIGEVVGPGLDGAGAGDAVDAGTGLAGEGVCDGAGVGPDGAGDAGDVGVGDDGGLGEFTGPGDCTGAGECTGPGEWTGVGE